MGVARKCVPRSCDALPERDPLLSMSRQLCRWGFRRFSLRECFVMSTTTIIVVLLVLLLFGGGWGYSRRGR
jgi:hypothetical protein